MFSFCGFVEWCYPDPSVFSQEEPPRVTTEHVAVFRHTRAQLRLVHGAWSVRRHHERATCADQRGRFTRVTGEFTTALSVSPILNVRLLLYVPSTSPFLTLFENGCKCSPMVLFTRNVKEIKDATWKNGDIDGMCKQSLMQIMSVQPILWNSHLRQWWTSTFVYLQLTLILLTSICHVNKATMSAVHEGILPQILVLIRSPLLQGKGCGLKLNESYIWRNPL